MAAPTAKRGATAYAFDDEPMQFGGTVGALFIMLFSHALLYYLYLSLELHGGALFVPTELSRYAAFLAEHAVPTASEVGVYAAFIALQTFLALVLPGLVLPGLPVRSLGGKRLDYNCNGWAAWVVTQLIVASLHFSGTFSVEWAADHYGALLTTMVCTGDAVALAVYAAGFLPRVPGEGHAGAFRRERMTGSHVYDFFMGASLNPRFGGPRAGGLDIKMWAEVRVSWITLFLLTLSAATKAASERGGEVGASFWIMLMAHWLYTNACVKGEECIITTWDIAHEKWGWMLCFWNLAGVPILYTWNCMYLLKHPAAAVPGGAAAAAVLFVLYLCAYFVWDTANSQKNYFRLVLNGTYKKPRPWYIFPQLPWKVVQKPAYIRTKAGRRSSSTAGGSTRGRSTTRWTSASRCAGASSAAPPTSCRTSTSASSPASSRTAPRATTSAAPPSTATTGGSTRRWCRTSSSPASGERGAAAAALGIGDHGRGSGECGVAVAEVEVKGQREGQPRRMPDFLKFL